MEKTINSFKKAIINGEIENIMELAKKVSKLQNIPEIYKKILIKQIQKNYKKLENTTKLFYIVRILYPKEFEKVLKTYIETILNKGKNNTHDHICIKNMIVQPERYLYFKAKDIKQFIYNLLHKKLNNDIENADLFEHEDYNIRILDDKLFIYFKNEYIFEFILDKKDIRMNITLDNELKFSYINIDKEIEITMYNEFVKKYSYIIEKYKNEAIWRDNLIELEIFDNIEEIHNELFDKIIKEIIWKECD